MIRPVFVSAIALVMTVVPTACGRSDTTAQSASSPKGDTARCTVEYFAPFSVGERPNKRVLQSTRKLPQKEAIEAVLRAGEGSAVIDISKNAPSSTVKKIQRALKTGTELRIARKVSLPVDDIRVSTLQASGGGKAMYVTTTCRNGSEALVEAIRQSS
jgi:hypothetical protein